MQKDAKRCKNFTSYFPSGFIISAFLTISLLTGLLLPTFRLVCRVLTNSALLRAHGKRIGWGYG